MYGKYWATVRIEDGSVMRAYVDAGSTYDARNLFESIYGDRVISNPQYSDDGGDMNTYWASVRIEDGSVMRAYVQAQTTYDAREMFRTMYGDRVISNPIPM